MVEEAIDRLPHRKDSGAIAEAMRNFKRKLNLTDGWRRTFPDMKAYTYLQSGEDRNAQSRIDRILVTNKIFQHTSDWTIESPGIDTDHQLISVKYSNPNMPFIGKGRWVMKQFLLKDKVLDRILAVGKEAESRMETIVEKRTHNDNPQLILKSMKEDFTAIFRQREKVAIPKMDRDIAKMRGDMRETLNSPFKGEDERLTEAASIQEKIDAAEKIRFQNIRDNTAARNRLDGESTATSYWTASNKARKPRDPTFGLQVPGSNPSTYVTRSDEMAELARDFHENLQSEGITDPEEKEEATKEALKGVKQLNQQHKAKLSQYLTRGDIAKVIKRLLTARHLE
ncbi:hypothetical protein K438DRAFT_1985728 [Mycena galopus ATCC 62051]|nr:hypothetical protein K438DRAFT_1985728 [Mycena galopus ATCC 62051]